MGKPSLKSEHHSANRVSAMSVRLAPRKARIVVDMIRGLGVLDALSILRFTNKRGALVIEKSSDGFGRQGYTQAGKIGLYRSSYS